MVKKNIRKYRIMEKHIELTKRGNYMVALNLLYLLRKGKIKLGLSDVDYDTEEFLESIDSPVTYSSNGYTATYRI